jgi:hypothetical protein
MNKRVAMAPPRRTPEDWVKQEPAPAPASTEPQKRLTIDVPESLHTRIKITCARNKLKMNALILEGVHRALEHYEREVA